jgi:hypothetical protein
VLVWHRAIPHHVLRCRQGSRYRGGIKQLEMALIGVCRREVPRRRGTIWRGNITMRLIVGLGFLFKASDGIEGTLLVERLDSGPLSTEKASHDRSLARFLFRR